MGLQPVTVPHHVNEPDVMDALPMFQLNVEPSVQPEHPAPVMPVGTTSVTNALSVTRGWYVAKLSYVSVTSLVVPGCSLIPGLQSVDTSPVQVPSHVQAALAHSVQV
jgi:hypothetical protein